MTPLLPITTIDQLNTLLDRHPYFRDRPSFPKHYWHAQCFLHLKHAQRTHTLPKTSTHHLAKTLGISHIVVSYWLRNERRPRLIEALTTHEQARKDHEIKLPQEHYQHRIDPSIVYKSIRLLKGHPHSPEALTNLIETMYHKVAFQRFLTADFKPYHESGPRWTRTIAKSLEKHREEVTKLLNQRIPLNHFPHTRIRIGIHNHTLYLYHHQTDPEAWLTRLRYEHFYFDTTDVKTLLLNDTKRHLNTTTTGLSQLTLQLTDHKGELTHRTSILGEYTRYRPYLTGETLQLLLNITGRNFKDIQLFITRLGRDTQGDGRGGIHNPIFLEGKQRDLFFTRITAIAFSDGHIHHENKAFTYIENEHERRHYVKNLMQSFGQVYITHDERPGADRLNMPVTIGRLLEQLGVPAGDKLLSPHYHLPKFIREGSTAVKCAYLEEVVPEDGYFHTKPQPKFGIKRAQILDAGPKANDYNFDSKITDYLKEFILEHGKHQETIFRDEAPREECILVRGRIKRLQQNPNQNISKVATQLQNIIKNNPCRLLKDEKQLCQDLGIEMEMKFKEIHIQQSGRVSSIWEIMTKSENDTLLWTEIAMPSSNPKRKKVQDWLEIRVNE